MSSTERPGERVLIAGVGYTNMRDLSVGPALVQRLRELAWSPSVQVEDMGYGAVAALHWFRERRDAFDVAVFITAVERGRVPGSVTRAEWSAPSVSSDEVQTRVTEAVTGIISLDTTLTVLAHFNALPPRVVTYEVEPRDQDWGMSFSLPVQAALLELERVLRSEFAEAVTA